MEKKISLEDIKSILEKSIGELKDKDKFLLKNDLHEQSITHKLAEYLQKNIGYSWNVDCEYNKYKKEEVYIKKEILAKYPGDKEVERKEVRPDIIIHIRDENDAKSNLLILEVKKKYRDELKESKDEKEAKDIDKAKLKCYTDKNCRLQYLYGAYLELWVGEEYMKTHKIIWYINGKGEDEY